MAQLSVAGRAARDGAAAGTRELAPWLVRLARVGYAAKGVVYVVIGTLAARAALGAGGETTDSRGALRTIGESALGRASLVLIGVGLLGYAAWRLIGAATDAEGHGPGAKGVAARLAETISGLLYGSLGVEALRLVAGSGRSAEGGDQAAHWTARVLAVPFGRALVIAAGAALAVYALQQIWRAVTKDPRERLDTGRMSARQATWVARLGRFGVAARGVVFTIVAWFLVRAALQHDPQQAQGIAESLDTIAGQGPGRLLLAAVAIGLVAYGLFQLANARWRRMRVA